MGLTDVIPAGGSILRGRKPFRRSSLVRAQVMSETAHLEPLDLVLRTPELKSHVQGPDTHFDAVRNRQ